MEVVFSAPGESLKLRLSPWERLPVDVLGRKLHLVVDCVQVWASECDMVDLQESLTAIRVRFGSDLGTAGRPLLVGGYYGPLEPGFTADFLTTDSEVQSVRVLKQLHVSRYTDVHSVVIGDEGEAVLKRIFDDAVPSPSEKYALKEVNDLRRSHGMACSSLPELVHEGWFLTSGKPTPHWNDAFARLIKPVGTCVTDMPRPLKAQALCTAAFHVLLALYHLFLLQRRHREVTPGNIIYVEDKNQFVLVDLKRAHEEQYVGKGEIADCLDLVFSLAKMAGWNCRHGFTAAANKLGEAHSLLSTFASYAAELSSPKSVPSYLTWLKAFGEELGMDSSAISLFVKGQHPPDGWEPPCL